MNTLPKAIIFDWDNTIIDTWPLIHSSMNQTMLQMGKEPWDMEKVKQNVHQSMRDYFPKIFGDDWQKAGEIWKNSYHQNHLEKIVLLPGALNLLNKVQELKITAFVVSNKMGATLRQEAKHLGINDKFFTLIGAHDAAEDKPSKKVVDLALLGTDLDPNHDHIWFIGDSFVDIECALNSGCQPVLFNEVNNLSRDLQRRIKENSEMPLLHFTSHHQVIKYLEENR